MHVGYAADVGKHYGTKTEIHFDNSIPAHVLYVNYQLNDVTPMFLFTAVLVEPMPVISDKGTYLNAEKPIYKSPYIDRKWVWFNSIKTNS